MSETSTESGSSEAFRISSLLFDFPVSDDHYAEPSTKSRIAPILNAYEKRIVVCVLDEMLQQLIIIKNGLPYPNFDWQKVEEKIDCRLTRITGKSSKHIFPLYHEYKMSPFWKIQCDRHFLQKIMQETREEVFAEGSYYGITRIIEEKKYVENEENNIIKDNITLTKSVVELVKKLQPKKAAVRQESNDDDQFATEDEIELDGKVINAISERYIEAWENARIDQNMMVIRKEEQNLEKQRKYLIEQQTSETRINQEIEAYLIIEIGKLEDQLAQWTSRYNKEVEARDNELLKVNTEKENVLNRMKSVVQKFHQHAEEIEELNKFFDDITKQQELQEKMEKSAILIQIWWRNYLDLKKEFLAKQGKNKKSKKK